MTAPNERSMSFRRGIFQLPCRPPMRNVRSFAERPIMDNVSLSEDNQVAFICKPGKKLALKNGACSIATIFGIPAEAITTMQLTNIDAWIQQRWDEEDPTNGDVFPFRHGPLFESDGLMAIKVATKGKEHAALRNKYIANHTLQDSLAAGVITHEQASRIKDGLDIIKAQEEDRNPDLSGPLTWSFVHMIETPDTFEVVPSGQYPALDVTIHAFPENTEIRRKNYWIYSTASGFGKTHFLKSLQRTHNATLVGDNKNMTGISEDSQFLLFDEVSSLPDVEMLKALTSGTGGVAMNKKTYGRSFKPREDVQVIICCNKSPYEVYGTYSPKMQRRYIDVGTREQLEARFSMIRLDGDMQADRLKYTDPIMWSEEEYLQTAQARFYSDCDQLQRAGMLTLRDVKNVLMTGLRVHQRRAGEGVTNIRHFEYTITQGMAACDADIIKYALSYKTDWADIRRYSSGDDRLVSLGDNNIHLHDPVPGAEVAPNYVRAIRPDQL